MSKYTDSGSIVAVSSSRALLIGGTGPTGAQVLDRATRPGLSLRALARRPEAVDSHRDTVEVVRGDVRDPASLKEAMDGVDTVISVLGTPLTTKPVDLLSIGTRNIIDAMHTTGAVRLICVTGMGAGDSRGHGGFVYDRLILPTLLRSIYADKDRQERAVRDSGLDWVLVRPAQLTNGKPGGVYQPVTQLRNGDRMRPISRADVAEFLVSEVLNPRYHRQVVNLSGGHSI